MLAERRQKVALEGSRIPMAHMQLSQLSGKTQPSLTNPRRGSKHLRLLPIDRVLGPVMRSSWLYSTVHVCFTKETHEIECRTVSRVRSTSHAARQTWFFKDTDRSERSSTKQRFVDLHFALFNPSLTRLHHNKLCFSIRHTTDAYHTFTPIL
jgi:hypothetical protein